MLHQREDLLRHYRQTRDELLRALEGLDEDVLSQPNADGWSIKDQLGHIALWDDVRAAEVERISAGHDSAWRMTAEQDDEYNALGLALRADLTPAQMKWELTISRQRLLTAITSATERGLEDTLYGEAGLRSAHESEHARWIQEWRQGRGV